MAVKKEDKMEVKTLLDEKDACKEMLATKTDEHTLRQCRGWRQRVNQRLRELGYVQRKKKVKSGS